eukprot:CAMPEP_0118929328 /NCGR_PEP_ID=MMETSP1169-20130426/6363_1 /TAXON_ID=36882 /ORGANISM="Pyramimonas obovata, Strain CCMP722" /LENGTH=83 /DNA_ID=CAMNT_0006871499 /DNA_START=159 /DNA_END=408 /DNA_ORIENTATION=-
MKGRPRLPALPGFLNRLWEGPDEGDVHSEQARGGEEGEDVVEEKEHAAQEAEDHQQHQQVWSKFQPAASKVSQQELIANLMEN